MSWFWVEWGEFYLLRFARRGPARYSFLCRLFYSPTRFSASSLCHRRLCCSANSVKCQILCPGVWILWAGWLAITGTGTGTFNARFFRAQPLQFSTEDSRVSFILSLLTGKGLSWAGPLIRSGSPIVSTRDSLMQEMISVFDCCITGHDAATRLMCLQQGVGGVAEFSIKFRALASETGWPEAPLMTISKVKDALATLEPPTTLDTPVRMAIRIDNRVQEWKRGKRGGKGHSSAPPGHFPSPSSHATLALSLGSPKSDEPMQMDS